MYTFVIRNVLIKSATKLTLLNSWISNVYNYVYKITNIYMYVDDDCVIHIHWNVSVILAGDSDPELPE